MFDIFSSVFERLRIEGHSSCISYVLVVSELRTQETLVRQMYIYEYEYPKMHDSAPREMLVKSESRLVGVLRGRSGRARPMKGFQQGIESRTEQSG